jgi:hypothetical protein
MMLRWLPTSAAAALAVATLTLDIPATSPVKTEQVPGTVSAAAWRAAIDPETGDLVTGVGAPSHSGDQAKARDVELANMLSRSDEGLEAVSYPDGRVSVHLNGRFMNASLARIDAQGKLETLCTEHAAEAHHFLHVDTEIDAHGREVR